MRGTNNVRIVGYFSVEVMSVKSSQACQRKQLIDAATATPELIKVQQNLKETLTKRSSNVHSHEKL